MSADELEDHLDLKDPGLKRHIQKSNQDYRRGKSSRCWRLPGRAQKIDGQIKKSERIDVFAFSVLGSPGFDVNFARLQNRNSQHSHGVRRTFENPQ